MPPLTLGSPASAYSSPVNFRIPQTADASLPKEVQAAFSEIYMGFQQVIFAFTDNCGIGPRPASDWPKFEGLASSILQQNMGRLYVQASEPILFGAMISLHNVAGALRVRNANATNNTKPCDGYCSTLSGINTAEIGEVILGGGVAAIGAITPGTRYYLSTTNGLISNVPAVAAGNIEQYIGVGLENNFLYTNIQYWIQH